MPDPKTAAAMQFRRQIVYLVVAEVISVPAVLVYLGSNGPMTATLAVTVTFGVFVSIVLGGGLMAAGFYSSGSGLDDAVAGAGVEPLTAPPTAADVKLTKPPIQPINEQGPQP